MKLRVDSNDTVEGLKENKPATNRERTKDDHRRHHAEGSLVRMSVGFSACAAENHK
jgi:hypothetical protein